MTVTRPLVTVVTLLRGGDTECRGRARPTAVPVFGRPVRRALLSTAVLGPPTTRRVGRVAVTRPLVTVVTLLRGGDTECRGRARPTAVPVFGRPVRRALLSTAVLGPPTTRRVGRAAVTRPLVTVVTLLRGGDTECRGRARPTAVPLFERPVRRALLSTAVLGPPTTRRVGRVAVTRPLVTVVTLLRGGDTECRGRARPTAVPLFERPARGALL